MLVSPQFELQKLGIRRKFKNAEAPGEPKEAVDKTPATKGISFKDKSANFTDLQGMPKLPFCP